MRQFIQRHPFWTYYVLAIAFPTCLYLYLIVLELTVHDAAWPKGSASAYFYATQALVMAAHPLATFHKDGVINSILCYIAVPFAAPFLLFPFAPTISAVIVTSFGRGWRALIRLLGCYRPVRGNIGWREGIGLYAILIAFIALAWGLTLALLNMFGSREDLTQYVHTIGAFDWRYFLAGWGVALFLNQGGLLEELGWRGYALPILIKRFHNPLIAAIVLGIAWSLWHFPRELPSLLTGQENIRELFQGQAVFIVSCICATIVFTSFVNLSGGSILPAIMLHGMMNHFFGALSHKMVGSRGEFMNPSHWVWIAGAILAVIVLGTDLGWKRRLAAHGGDGSTDPARAWSQ